MKNKPVNEMRLEFDSKSINESFARYAVSAFVAQLDPTVDELSDLRCAVSEAVTNAIVHGYRDTTGIVYITCKYYEDRTVKVKVTDKGVGIEDIKQAMQPLYTTDPAGERGGMGFAIMQSFTDNLTVRTKPGKGTAVTMTKKLSPKA